MNDELLKTLLVAAIGVIGGGAMAAMIQSLFGKKKNKAEVHGLQLKNILEMESRSFERYQQIETMLTEIRRELDADKMYISVLQNFIRANGLDVPERPGFKRVSD